MTNAFADEIGWVGQQPPFRQEFICLICQKFYSPVSSHLFSSDSITGTYPFPVGSREPLPAGFDVGLCFRGLHPAVLPGKSVIMLFAHPASLAIWSRRMVELFASQQICFCDHGAFSPVANALQRTRVERHGSTLRCFLCFRCRSRKTEPYAAGAFIARGLSSAGLLTSEDGFVR